MYFVRDLGVVGACVYEIIWNFWEILGNLGKSWEILGIFGNFWEILGIFGNFWEILGIFGNFWEILYGLRQRPYSFPKNQLFF